MQGYPEIKKAYGSIGIDLSYKTASAETITKLLVKLGKGRRLNKKEITVLSNWRAESVTNEELATKFENPEWIAESLRILDEVPQEKILRSANESMGKLRGASESQKENVAKSIRKSAILLLLIVLAILGLLISVFGGVR
jgi:hypothetical protein